jgi:hypothetical protein
MCLFFIIKILLKLILFLFVCHVEPSGKNKIKNKHYMRELCNFKILRWTINTLTTN